jgi:hypothetical protein
MKKRITSENYFHKKPENLNCAQAILKGFQQELNIDDSHIEEFRAHGGGRAPEGICGALYAAEHLAKKHNLGDLKADFEKETGHTNCKELKSNLKVTCEKCVKIADSFLERKIYNKE